MVEERIVVHPLVLLSITDHFMRSNKERVAGMIIGSVVENVIHITNSYAVPFEETDDSHWYFDTTYHVTMSDLLKKVIHNEKVLGWYHTGGKMHKNDLLISKSLEQFITSPYMLIVSVLPTNRLPVEVFQLENDQLHYKKICIEAEESEEVGVEHLLRGIKREDNHFENVMKESLKSYKSSLIKIEEYLDDVLQGKIKKNYKILSILQECLNERPQFVYSEEEKLLECYSVELTKVIVGLNDLETNKSLL
ncbi:hypothetical protein H312_00686 [Anncaliia algerae PRA339]|uniref:MPN domain-containing protein n=1 Tax=Anncaliia algerae PRA339 TaxID=1288291 RepID=A0A059F3Z7_9MICR|nr:hypothetical protein H312_00686 [Anncaliia algerae PRA339]